jgi:diguanylate cyclase (GGDEF)-like protein
LILLYAHAIRTTWNQVVIPKPGRMNLEKFRWLVMQAQSEVLDGEDNPFEPILQQLLHYAAISDSIPDHALKDLTHMVNSLPTLRRRSSDGDTASHAHVILIDGFGSLARTLATALSQMTVEVSVVQEMDDICPTKNPGLADARVVIVGEAILEEGKVAAMVSALKSFSTTSLEPPAVVLAALNPLTFEQRLAATQFGCVRIFRTEDEPRAIREFVLNATTDAKLAGSKVLLIDDSLTDAYRATTYMHEAGLLVEHVADPSNALDAIRRFAPDLIVLDYHMPVANGDVMASLIRQDPEMTVPIIFLSSMSDTEQQLMAISHGADGFVTKPLQQGAFIKAIKSMIARSRSIDRRMRRDPLTCLLNHSQILESAKRLVGEGRTGALAIIDIDHFKTINDTYGHPVGDRVLIKMAEFLTVALRESDFVGRIGGEEFAIVLPETTPEMAFQVMERIRTSFENVQHEADNDSFACTFSCGITKLDAGVATAICQADEALYQAKHGGRNQVVISSEATDTAEPA